MNKVELKNILKNVKVHEIIELGFTNGKVNLNGSYKAVSFQTKKGRGGVYEGKFQNTQSGETIIISSKENEDILSLKRADGSFYGYETEVQAQQSQPYNVAREEVAPKLYEQVQRLENKIGEKVNLKTRDQSADGVYTLEMIKKAKGKYKQMIVCLRSSDNKPFEIWTRKSSGWVDSIEPV